ncbi:MAG: hypothetical protein QM498_04740 [Desulfobacterium sp.]
MDPIYKIEKATHLGSVRTFLKTFLKAEKDRSLLIPVRSSHNNTVMPTLVTDPDVLDQADPFSPSFPLNSAKLVSKLTRKGAGEPMAAFLRPCEIRAFVELVKIKQANWDNLVIISADCAGAFSNSIFREKAANEKEAFTQSFLDKRLGSNLTDTMDDSIATACTTPPFSFIRSNCSSSKFLLWSHKVLAEECEAIIGAFESAMVCFIDALEMWETSIIIPNLLSSFTAFFPNSLSPWCFHSPSCSPVCESQNWLCPL